MGFAKIHGELTSRIGQPVRFGAPRDVSQRGGGGAEGAIIDEVWADPATNKLPRRAPRSKQDWGDYSFCSQLIRWDDGNHSIRLGYYRRRAGEDWWEFASQTTVVSEWDTIKALLEATLAKKNWFVDSPQIL
jgi:hypothetical protein